MSTKDAENTQPRVRLFTPGDDNPARFERGDVVEISAPAATAVVTWTTDSSVHLDRWPWGPADQGVGVPFDLAERRKGWGVWRFDPEPGPDLQPGDEIRISIPATVVHVTWDTPGACFGALPYGVQEDINNRRPDKPDEMLIYPQAPLTIDLIHRPYGFLHEQDEVLDPAGETWTFYQPIRWMQHGIALRTGKVTGATEGPQWPLRLVQRLMGEPSEDEKAAVAAATAAGSHADELAAWEQASGTTLAEIIFDDPEPRLSPKAREAEAGRVRANLRGRTLAELQADLDQARHWYRVVSKVVITEEDELNEELAGLRLDETQRVLEHLTASGAATYDGSAPA